MNVMPGFSVVADALIDASLGVTNTVATMRGCPVRQLDPGVGAVGHPPLADAISEFCDRWQVGLSNLVQDNDQYAAHLRDAASAYIGVDVGVADALRGPS